MNTPKKPPGLDKRLSEAKTALREARKEHERMERLAQKAPERWCVACAEAYEARVAAAQIVLEMGGSL
jgi:hypothetical protein